MRFRNIGTGFTLVALIAATSTTAWGVSERDTMARQLRRRWPESEEDPYARRSLEIQFW